MWKLQKIINKARRDKRGFTIAEMVVVSGIFAVLTTVILFKYGDFNSSILVTNMAYEVAITTRQAQIFGVSARGFDQSDGGGFEYPYGVSFNLLDQSTGSDQVTKNFTLFVDRNESDESGYGRCSNGAGGVGDCDCISEGDECIERLGMTQGVKISEIRVNKGTGCNTTRLYRAAVTFKRPSPEARIETISHPLDDQALEFLEVKIEGKSSSVKPVYVLIRKTGQISVSQTSICSPIV